MSKPLERYSYAEIAKFSGRPELVSSLLVDPPAAGAAGASTVLAGYPVSAGSDSQATGDRSASTERTYERPNLDQLNARLPRYFVEQVKLYAFMQHMPVAKLIQVALEEFMQRASTDRSASTNSTTSTLLIDDKTDEDIISLYEKLTTRKFSASDKQTLAELRQQHEPNHIRVGILLSVLRANKRINSLKYCVGAIGEAASLSPQKAEEYLRYLRNKMQRTEKEKPSS